MSLKCTEQTMRNPSRRPNSRPVLLYFVNLHTSGFINVWSDEWENNYIVVWNASELNDNFWMIRCQKAYKNTNARTNDSPGICTLIGFDNPKQTVLPTPTLALCSILNCLWYQFITLSRKKWATKSMSEVSQLVSCRYVGVWNLAVHHNTQIFHRE